MLEREIEIEVDRRLDVVTRLYLRGQLTMADARRAAVDVGRWAGRQYAMCGALKDDLRAMEDEPAPLLDPVILLPEVSAVPPSRNWRVTARKTRERAKWAALAARNLSELQDS